MAVEYKDYYRTLGVGRNATEKEIRAAYRKLARKYHPDVNPGNKEAEARFKEINEAYQVLSDPEKRQKYDRFGADWERYRETSPGARETDFGRWFTGRTGGVHFEYEPADGGGFSDFFRTLFGSFAGTRTGPTTAGQRVRMQRGADIEQEVEVSLEEAYNGATRILQLQTEENCPECGGVGIRQSQLCDTCRGRGTVTRRRRIEAKIPAGVYDGARVRIAGQGEPGVGGAPAGDLYLRIKLLPSPGFELEGADVHVDVPVDLYTCALGGEVQVPTPGGKRLMLTIPPNTNSGTVFRLRGQGMPVLQNPSKKGDLLAKVSVRLPKLSEQQKDLLRRMREMGSS